MRSVVVVLSETLEAKLLAAGDARRVNAGHTNSSRNSSRSRGGGRPVARPCSSHGRWSRNDEVLHKTGTLTAPIDAPCSPFHPPQRTNVLRPNDASLTQVMSEKHFQDSKDHLLAAFKGLPVWTTPHCLDRSPDWTPRQGVCAFGRWASSRHRVRSCR